MIKVTFTEYVSFGNEAKEQLEFEDGTSNEEIQQEFECWVWERVGDNFNWSKED